MKRSVMAPTQPAGLTDPRRRPIAAQSIRVDKRASNPKEIRTLSKSFSVEFSGIF